MKKFDLVFLPYIPHPNKDRYCWDALICIVCEDPEMIADIYTTTVNRIITVEEAQYYMSKFNDPRPLMARELNDIIYKYIDQTKSYTFLSLGSIFDKHTKDYLLPNDEIYEAIQTQKLTANTKLNRILNWLSKNNHAYGVDYDTIRIEDKDVVHPFSSRK